MSLVKFEDDFLDKILALSLRDNNFAERTDGLIKPEFFDNEINKYICSISLDHYEKYRQTPSAPALAHRFKEDQEAGIVRKELVSSISSKFKTLYRVDLSDREFVIDKVADFIRKQAVTQATLAAAEILDKNDDVCKILPIMQRALDVGTNELSTSYDFKNSVKQRSAIRKARLSGSLEYNSVSTGFKEFDDTLYHKGWGKKELTLYMGPSKAGKSVALLEHALRAAERGYNTLFVSLEISTEVQADRMDSNISGVKMTDINVHIDKVEDRVDKWSLKAANLKLHEYPTGAFRVSDLRRLIKKYQAIGTTFDLVVIDYADIMLSESKSNEGIDRSKQVLIDLRALAQGENVAILSATQTNREGAKVDVIEAIHVAEDYNKIRIADLVISINCNDIERTTGEARLFFAASRNQKAVTITVKRDLEIMRHIKEVIDVK